MMHLFVHTESKNAQGFRYYVTVFDPSNVCLDLMRSAYRQWYCTESCRYFGLYLLSFFFYLSLKLLPPPLYKI